MKAFAALYRELDSTTSNLAKQSALRAYLRAAAPADDALDGHDVLVPPGQEGVVQVDWKDVTLLRKFISDRGKIRSRRVTGLTAQEQRDVAKAIKNAREMALLPYHHK